MSKFVCEPSVPKEARAALQTYFAPLEWMIPAWCGRVVVQWDAEAGGCSAHATVHFEYRFAELIITSLFFECDEDVRRDTAIHELLHLHINPLFNYSDRTIGALLEEDEPHRKQALEELKRYVEGVTQDLTDTVFKRLTPEYVPGPRRKVKEGAALKTNIPKAKIKAAVKAVVNKRR